MEVIHTRCAGLDISKKDAKVCICIAGAGRRKTVETVTTWGSMTNQVIALREHLVAEKVTCVVMEATSDYWKPFYYLLEDLPGVELMLVNARHVKNLPGRKTDVADATWLAQLGAHGLVRGSFVPPEPIRHLRDLTRARTAITRERSREVQRHDEEPSVQMPPALLRRVARILETAADLVGAGLVGYEADPDESAGLPSAFRRDVDLLRTMAGQEQRS